MNFSPPASCLAPLSERTVEGYVGIKIYKVNGAWIDFCGILMYNGRSEVKNYGLDRKRKTSLYATKSERHDAKTGGGQAGNQPKTVSKWETGHGFPDVSTLSDLADIFGVSERTLLSGRLARNMQETGNLTALLSAFARALMCYNKVVTLTPKVI